MSGTFKLLNFVYIFYLTAFPNCSNGIEVIDESDFNNGIFDCSDNSDEPHELCECRIKLLFRENDTIHWLSLCPVWIIVLCG